MEIFRTGHDIWGRTVLEGVSWDLVWVAVGIGVAVIIGHALYQALRRRSGE
jgi:hypothetical protein